MPLLVDHMSVWDIGLRWASYDPNRFYPRLPLLAKDHLRNLMDAVLNAELACQTLVHRKPQENDDVLNEVSIYLYLDDIEACIAGRRFKRKMLRWAIIERYDLKDWCERRGIPLPEFWFPVGWKLEYERSEDMPLPGWRQVMLTRFPSDPDRDRGAFVGVDEIDTSTDGDDTGARGEDSRAEGTPEIVGRRASKTACQKVASSLWRERPDLTIASVVRDPIIQNYCGGKHYSADTVREWVRQVAPQHVSAKRGRPRKENGGESQ